MGQHSNLVPPPAPRKLCLSDREERKRRKIEGPQTPMKEREMEYNKEIAIPSITSKRGFRSIASRNHSIFLQPRMSRTCTSPPRIVRKGSLKDRDSSEADIFNNGRFFENLNINTSPRKKNFDRRVLFPAF